MENNDPGKLVRLSSEHKVIIDFIARFDKLISIDSYSELGQLIKSIYFFLEHDLQKHFMLEEEIIFPVALKFYNSVEMKKLINTLEEQHLNISNDLSSIINMIKSSKWVTYKGNEEYIKKINIFLNKMRAHIKLELDELYPQLESNDKIIETILKS